MVKLWDVMNNCAVHVRADQIAEVVDRVNHYGARAQVRLLGGRLIETTESADQILAAIEKDLDGTK